MTTLLWLLAPLALVGALTVCVVLGLVVHVVTEARRDESDHRRGMH